MKMWLIINRAAGGALSADISALAARTTAVFQNADWDVVTALVAPENIEHEIERATAAQPDMVVVGGGDGTIRTAADHLMHTPIALGILPLGTLNRLARDLELPLDVDAAAVALATGQQTRIDVGKVNVSVFLCQSMLGLPPKFAEDRQAWRGVAWPERVQRMWRTARTFVRTRRRLTLTLDDGSKVQRLRALSLIVANNPYSEAADAQLRRPTLAGGALGVYISRHRNGLGLVLATLRIFFGQHSRDPDLEIMRVKQMTVGSTKGRLRLSNDGEVEKLSTPLVYEIFPGALTVTVPAASETEAVSTQQSTWSQVQREEAKADDLEALAKAQSL